MQRFLERTYDLQKYALLLRFRNFLRDLPNHFQGSQLVVIRRNLKSVVEIKYDHVFDYLNWKGEGFFTELHGLDYRFGLSIVLLEMESINQYSDPLKKFSTAAAKVLLGRVALREADFGPHHREFMRRACSYADDIVDSFYWDCQRQCMTKLYLGEQHPTHIERVYRQSNVKKC